MHQQEATPARIAERDMSCCRRFHMAGRAPSFWAGATVATSSPASSCDLTSTYLRTSLATLHKSPPLRAVFNTGRASRLRRRAYPHTCCIVYAAALCSSRANMSDPPPAKKPAFSLYGDLIAPNGDSSVITSGPVKYDMKAKDPEPEAQKKKNGRVAFYISSS